VPEKTARAAITPIPSLAKHKVLIVDDNGDSAAALGIILDVEGYPSIEANDGATALAQAVGFGARVGIIDIGLPDMSGFDVARGLREQFRERPLTLIALSGYSSEDFRQQASAAGFDHYFAKPLKMDDLLALLATLPVASMS
jgi:DNA-binding response OmpR family regulator